MPASFTGIFAVLHNAQTGFLWAWPMEERLIGQTCEIRTEERSDPPVTNSSSCLLIPHGFQNSLKKIAKEPVVSQIRNKNLEVVVNEK